MTKKEKNTQQTTLMVMHGDFSELQLIKNLVKVTTQHKSLHLELS